MKTPNTPADTKNMGLDTSIPRWQGVSSTRNILQVQSDLQILHTHDRLLDHLTVQSGNFVKLEAVLRMGEKPVDHAAVVVQVGG
ncbi:MAG: hypothetical protein ABW166_06505 [Sedimenticola sp.]